MFVSLDFLDHIFGDTSRAGDAHHFRAQYLTVELLNSSVHCSYDGNSRDLTFAPSDVITR